MHMKYGLIVASALTVIAALSLNAAGMTAEAQQPAPAAAPQAPPSAANYKGVNKLLPTEDAAKGRRRFEAGAHTAWHIHPAGQLIHVEEGVGVVQRRGEPVKVLRKGETDFTPAGVPHWHGAAPDTHSVMALVHFGGIGPWLEPVTDAEYAEKTKHLLAKGSPTPQPRAAATETPATGSSPQNYFGVTNTLPSDDMQVARGRFEAGAYTNWHVHPRGQVILAEEGPVFVQRRGQPLKVLKKGESDFTPPGVEHWHGAGPDAHAQKIVVGYGAPTQWLEPVSEADYAQTRKMKQ
jgi:quercetin dioxygenase-like cupin family protein